MPLDTKIVNGQNIKLYSLNNTSHSMIYMNENQVTIGGNASEVTFDSGYLNSTNSSFTIRSIIADGVVNIKNLATVDGNPIFNGLIKAKGKIMLNSIGDYGTISMSSNNSTEDGWRITSPKVNEFVLRNTSEIRFSDSNNYNYDSWAGLKYNSTSKVIYLGGAGTAFTSSGAGTDVTVDLTNRVSSVKLPTSVNASGTVTVGTQVNIVDANTYIAKGNANSLRVQTSSGYLDIGPQNTNWCHFNSDRDFYFGRKIEVNGDIKVYGSTTYLSATIGKINNFTILTSNDIGSHVDNTLSKLANTRELNDIKITADGALQKTGGTISGSVYLNCDNGVGTENTGNKLYLTRTAATTNEFASHNVGDGVYTVHYKNDEANSYIKFLLENTDTEAGGGALANTKTITFCGSNTDCSILVNGNRTLTQADEGHTKGIDADTLDGLHANTSSCWNKIPSINSSGVMEVGKFIDFHLTDASVTDYEPRLQATDSSNLSINANKIWHAGDATITATTFTGALNGNANTSSKWLTARTITLGGDLTGNVSIDGSANVTLTAAVVDDSHNHTNLTGLTSLKFSTQATDYAEIKTTFDSNVTYMDFELKDDPNQEQWRWRFTPSGGTIFDAMILKPTSLTKADLVVQGDVQATTFIGALTGNASTSSKWLTARTITLTGDVTGSVSIDGSANVSITTVVGDDSHEHKYVKVADTRNTNSTPAEVTGFSYKPEFKNRTTIDNAPGTGAYNGCVTLTPYTDPSGGNTYQMSYGFSSATVPALGIRTNAFGAVTWGPWYEIYHTGKKPTAVEVGARPDTWVPSWTDVTGKPTTFTPSTHNHDTDYLKLSGGTLTGNLNIGTNEIRAGGTSNESLILTSKNGAVFLRPVFGVTTDDFIVTNAGITYRGNKVYHAGDKPTAADIGALPAVGGTISGDITINGNVTIGTTAKNFIATNNYGYQVKDSSGTAQYVLYMNTSNQIIVGYNNRSLMIDYDNPTVRGGYKIWHANNDGAGSTLDADLLDGYHETSFVRLDTVRTGYISIKGSVTQLATDDTSLGFTSVSNLPTIRTGGAFNKDIQVMGSSDTLRAKITTTGTIEVEENLKAKGSLSIGDNKATMQFNVANETIDFIFN